MGPGRPEFKTVKISDIYVTRPTRTDKIACFSKKKRRLSYFWYCETGPTWFQYHIPDEADPNWWKTAKTRFWFSIFSILSNLQIHILIWLTQITWLDRPEFLKVGHFSKKNEVFLIFAVREARPEFRIIIIGGRPELIKYSKNKVPIFYFFYLSVSFCEFTRIPNS